MSSDTRPAPDIIQAEHQKDADARRVIGADTSGTKFQLASETSLSNLAMAITNAIDSTAYDLNAAAFSTTTSITNDFILDNIEFNFSTTESKTITITSTDGTQIWNDTNTNQHIVLDKIDLAVNGGENITVAVTQFSSAGTMDCVLKVKQGSNTLFGNPILDPGSKTQLVDAAGNVLEFEQGDGGDWVLKVHNEHVHHKMWNHYFSLDTGVTSTTNGVVAVDSKTVILDDASSFSAGDIIDIYQNSTHAHIYRKIISIATNTLTIDSGLDVEIADGSTVVQTSFNMAVDGSVTPQVFTMKPSGTNIIDITRLLLEIVDGTAADDSRFGGASALTNGVHIRKNINNGESYQTLAIWRANKDMKEDMYNVDYTDKSGGGNYGVNGRWTILESGAIINLDASNNEFLECVIQDDLTVLIDFQVKAQGHFEQD